MSENSNLTNKRPRSLIPKDKPPTEFVTCFDCGKNKKKTEFYKSLNNSVGVLPYCKECLKKRVLEDDDETININLFKAFLKDKNVDRPFLTYMWKTAMESKAKDKVGEYFKLINNISYQEYRWENSDDKDMAIVESKDEYEVVGFAKKPKTVITDDIVRRWGLGYEPEEYAEMERLYSKFSQDFDIETNIQEEYLKNAVIAQMRNLKALAMNDVESAKKWGAQFDSYMASGKLKPNQISDLDKMGGVDSFSTFFQYIEKSEKFIPTFPDIIIDDIDYAIFSMLNYNRTLLGLPKIELGEVKEFMTYDYESGQEVIFPKKVE